MRARMFVLGAIPVALSAPLSLATAQTGDADSDPRAMLGIEVSMSGTSRDTLGVLVSSVVSGSPADRAGVQERDRIAEVNGMSLRVSPEDVGRQEAREIVERRLTRELGSLRPGDVIELRVFTGARSRSVTIRLSEAEDVRSRARSRDDEASIQGVIASLRETQAQLRQLVAQERAGAVQDSLAEAEREIAQLQRRLQVIEIQRRRRMERLRGDDDDERRTDESPGNLRGLRVTVVSDDLEPYFGEGSARGLLVLEVDESWAPIRVGDVIVRVDGTRATTESLRDALDSRRETEVELLRRRRSIIVTINARNAGG